MKHRTTGKQLNKILTGEESPRFLSDKEIVTVSKCLKIINEIEDELQGYKMMVSVEGSKPVTFAEFKKINTSKGVEPLSNEEFESILNLEVGEVRYFGMNVEVKRVS